jgi:small subunit ribosomal protein S2
MTCQTLDRIDTAYRFVRETSPGAGRVLPSAPEAGAGAHRAQAQACGMPYVNFRWLGGMLTNPRRCTRAAVCAVQRMVDTGEVDLMSKKEGLKLAAISRSSSATSAASRTWRSS